MIAKQMVTGTLSIVFILSWVGAANSSFEIQSKEAVHLEIKGYDGLTEITLFHGELAAGIRQHVETSYRGLGLLRFAQGDVYPVILGNQPFLLKISGPDTMPYFTGSDENEYFYALLEGEKTGNEQYEFADLMFKAKQLLDTTGSVRTFEELQAMKERFHTFVRTHYQDLYHSDMLKRLIAQYFMMHEYVDYHVPGAPVTDIRVRYRQAVMDGVRNWLDILKPNIPQHEVLNYCVSLYYDRSMVTLASKITENFRDVADCPGDESPIPVFPPNLALIDLNGNNKLFKEFSGKKTIAFVSDDCPVSKVETVVNARLLSQQRNTTLIAVSLQPLSENHLSMQKMVGGGTIMFVNDEKWRKENVPQQMKLPQFIQIEEK